MGELNISTQDWVGMVSSDRERMNADDDPTNDSDPNKEISVGINDYHKSGQIHAWAQEKLDAGLDPESTPGKVDTNFNGVDDRVEMTTQEGDPIDKDAFAAALESIDGQGDYTQGDNQRIRRTVALMDKHGISKDRAAGIVDGRIRPEGVSRDPTKTTLPTDHDPSGANDRAEVDGAIQRARAAAQSATTDSSGGGVLGSPLVIAGGIGVGALIIYMVFL